MGLSGVNEISMSCVNSIVASESLQAVIDKTYTMSVPYFTVQHEKSHCVSYLLLVHTVNHPGMDLALSLK